MPADGTAVGETTLASRRATTLRSANNRSRIGNGKTLIAGLDKRSEAYRQYQDCVADLCAHLGGSPTAVQLAVVSEAATLIVWTRSQRLALLTKGEEFDIGTYTTATNSLRRLLADIGQEARLKDVTPYSDRLIEQERAARRAADEATADLVPLPVTDSGQHADAASDATGASGKP